MKSVLSSIAIGAVCVFTAVGRPGVAATAPLTALPNIAASAEHDGSGVCLKRHRPLPSRARAQPARKGIPRNGRTASDNHANDLNARELARSGEPGPAR